MPIGNGIIQRMMPPEAAIAEHQLDVGPHAQAPDAAREN